MRLTAPRGRCELNALEQAFQAIHWVENLGCNFDINWAQSAATLNIFSRQEAVVGVGDLNRLTALIQRVAGMIETTSPATAAQPPATATSPSCCGGCETPCNEKDNLMLWVG